MFNACLIRACAIIDFHRSDNMPVQFFYFFPAFPRLVKGFLQHGAVSPPQIPARIAFQRGMDSDTPAKIGFSHTVFNILAIVDNKKSPRVFYG
jgi:hypothetical protein